MLINSLLSAWAIFWETVADILAKSFLNLEARSFSVSVSSCFFAIEGEFSFFIKSSVTRTGILTPAIRAAMILWRPSPPKI